MDYTVKAAARATGISESRLRTWERRYGIPRPRRSATGRRLYDDGDLAIIRRMAALVAAGVGAAEAADAARSEEPSPAPPPSAAPTVHVLVRPLVEAGLLHDEEGVVTALRSAVKSMGWADALDLVVFPAMREVGLGWAEEGVSCATEHFISELIRRELAAATAGLATAPASAPSVMLACPDDERHELGLLAFGLLLRGLGLRVIYLGADVPAAELIALGRRLSPDAICLAATAQSGLASLGRAGRELIAARIDAKLFVGGPALAQATGRERIAGVHLPRSLRDAAGFMVEALVGVGKEGA